MNRLSLRALAAAATVLMLSCTTEEGGPAPSSAPKPARGGAEQAFPGKEGVLRGGSLFGETIRYKQVEGHKVFGGDIVLDGINLDPAPLAKSGAVGRTAAASRWVNNIVYYRFAAGFTRPAEATAAIALWEANTLVKFVQWNSTMTGHPDVVEFQSVENAGCYSGGIGRMGGVQVINLGAGCGTGNAIHEIGHAVGLYHEQSRSDQAFTISVDYNNIPASVKDRYFVFSNPLRAPAPLDGADYTAIDYGSIMMDGSFDFALNPSLPVMKKLTDNSTWTAQRTTLSAGDIAGVGTMYPSFWKTVPNSALTTDIGVGANGTAFRLNQTATNGGYQIFKWNGSAWSQITGGATALDVDAAGVLWVINSSGEIYTLNANGSWANKGASGKKYVDVGVGSNGTVFATTYSPAAGYQLFKRNGSSWTLFASGPAGRVTVDNTGKPWIINPTTFAIQRWNGTAWVTVSGTGYDVGAGPDGSVFVVENVNVTGGKAVSVFNGVGLSRLDKAGYSVDVGPNGNPWVGSINTGHILVGSTVPGATGGAGASGWNSESVQATTIGLGGSSAAPVAWVTSSTFGTGGYSLFRKAGASGAWTSVAGAAIKLDVTPTGELWAVTSNAEAWTYDGTSWTNRSGASRFFDISVGADGTVYGVTQIAQPFGFQVCRYTGSGWAVLPSKGGFQIAVDNTGKPWIMNTSNTVQRWDGAAWITLPGSAADIAAGSNGTVYKLGTVDLPGGKTVWRWNGTAWMQIDASASNIDVDAAGNPWLVRSDYTLRNWIPGSEGPLPPLKPVPDADPPALVPPAVPAGWQTESSAATDIGVGGKVEALTAMAVTATEGEGGKTLNRKKPSNTWPWPWQTIAGGAIRVETDPNGDFWLINNLNELWFYKDGWGNRGGAMRFTDIAVGADGSVFGVSTIPYQAGFRIFKWSDANENWSEFASGGAVRVTVDDAGKPLIVNANNAAKRWDGSAWIALPGSAIDIAAAGGQTYKLGTTDVTGGKALWRLAGAAWTQVEGSGIALDVDAYGNPWLVQADNVLKSWIPGDANGLPPAISEPISDPDTVPVAPPPGTWQVESILATEIGVGGSLAAITAWAATTTDANGGKALSRRLPGAGWQDVAGGAIRVETDPSGNLWDINSSNDIWYYNGGWGNRSGGKKFLDVAVGSEGSVFAVSQIAFKAGYKLLKWTGSDWIEFASGGATRVTVDDLGRPLIVNSNAAVKQWDGSAWIHLPGSGSDIGAAGGKIYKVGTAEITGGKTFWRWGGASWVQIEGAALSVDLDPAGNPWLVQSDNVLKSWKPGLADDMPPVKADPSSDPDTVPPPVIPGGWVTESATATEIGIGGAVATLSAWIATDVQGDGGKTIKTKSSASPTAWQTIVGAGIKVEGDPSGNLWNINGNSDMWFYSNGGWTNRSAGKKFNDLGVGGDGSVFAVTQTASGAGFQLVKWTGSAWNVFPSGGAVKVTVDNTGKPWIVNSRNAVHRWDGAAWIATPGSGTDIGSGGGKVFKAGTVDVTGGKTVWAWTGTAWAQIEGAAIALDADPSGNPHLVQSDFALKSWNPGSAEATPPLKAVPDADPDSILAPAVPAGWHTENVAATDVGIGGTAQSLSAWAASNTPVNGGKTLYTRAGANGEPWQLVVGGLLRLDADPAGMLWVTNSYGDAYTLSGTSWTNRSAGKKFNDISVGADGSVFAVSQTASGAGFQLLKWWNSTWIDFPSGGAVRVSVDNAGKPWIVNSRNAVHRWDGTAWVPTPGSGTDVGCGGGKVFKVGTVDVTGGKTAWAWTGSGWAQLDGAAVAVDADPAGNPFLVQSDLVMKSWYPGTAGATPTLKSVPDMDPDSLAAPPVIPGSWKTEPVVATEIGVGGTIGTVTAWITTATDVNGGKTLNRLGGGQWQTVVGGAVRVEPAPNGELWVVNSYNDIYSYNNGSWVNRNIGQKGRDIGIGANGTIFAVSNFTTAPKGFALYKWTGSGWSLFACEGAMRVTVDASGYPWIVNNQNAVQQWTGTAWVTLPGSATDIGAGSVGAIFKVGTVPIVGGNTVWKWDGSAWIQLDAAAIAVDADPTGNPWLVQSDNSLKSWDPGSAGATPPAKAFPDADPEPDASVPPTFEFNLLGVSGDIVAMFGTTSASGYALDKLNVRAGGYGLRRIIGASYTILSKRFVDIDVGKDCEVWGVTDTGTVFFNSNACADPNAWQPGSDANTPFFIKIIAGPDAASGASQVYAISNTAGLGGGGKMYKRGGDGTWSLITNNGMAEADIQTTGTIFGIQGGQVVIFYPGNAQDQVGPMGLANALNIASGAGRELALTDTPAPGGTQLKGWTNQGWVAISPGQGFTDVQIAPDGRVWATDSGKQIWFMTPTFTPGAHPAAPGGYVPNF